MKKPAVKLELVSPQTAEKEKEIESQWKCFGLADKGAFRSESLLYAYSAIMGAAANRLAELLPEGSLEVGLRTRFPHRSISQIGVYRRFVKDLLPHLANSPTVGLLTAPVIGKKQILMKKLEGLQEAVKLVLKGATMVEFHKASQFAGEVEKDGGYRPDPEMVQEFLGEKHADLKGKTYDELSPEIQGEFRKWLATRPEPPADIAKRANDQGEAHKQAMLAAITGKWAMAMSKKLRADNLTLAEKWVEKLKAISQKEEKA
jgi:hypothetical protein